MKAKLDDITAFGCSHHDHSKHRVSVSGLTFDEASVLEGAMNQFISGNFKRESPLDNRTKDEFTKFHKGEICERDYIYIRWNGSEAKGGQLSKEDIIDLYRKEPVVLEPKTNRHTFENNGKKLAECSKEELLNVIDVFFAKIESLERQIK